MIKSKLALVDFDGVVLKNRKALSFVNNKAERYVAKHLDIKDKLAIARMNKELYTTYGHTVLGLHAMGCSTVSKKCFDQFVYSDLDPSLALTEEEVKNWDTFYNIMKGEGYHISIFSSAPYTWCDHFLDKDKYEFNYVKDILSMRPIECDEDFIKPNRRIFDMLHYHLRNVENITYFEDKMLNFRHVMNYAKWCNVWVAEDLNEPYVFDNGVLAFPTLAEFDPAVAQKQFSLLY
jgi:hypothetical protein